MTVDCPQCGYPGICCPENEIKQLREALGKYGLHIETCPRYQGPSGYYEWAPCNCGFSDILKPEAGAAPAGEAEEIRLSVIVCSVCKTRYKISLHPSFCPKCGVNHDEPRVE